MITKCTINEGYEISPRFRQSVEDRIARLERDAEADEAHVVELQDIDHIRRQMHLVAAQRTEALRMRLFLDLARTPVPRPFVEVGRTEIRELGSDRALDSE